MKTGGLIEQQAKRELSAPKLTPPESTSAESR